MGITANNKHVHAVPGHTGPHLFCLVCVAMLLLHALVQGVPPSGNAFSTPRSKAGFVHLTVNTRKGQVPVMLPRREYAFNAMEHTYYLSAAGDDAQEGSRQHPWHTFEHAMTLLKPGDLLYVRAGEYPTPFQIKTSGEAQRPIILSAYPGEQVHVFTPEGWQKQHPNQAVVTFVGVQHIWLHGFWIEGCLGQPDAPPDDTYGQNGISLVGGGGEGVRILNNQVCHAQHCGIKEMGHGGHDFLLEGNVVYENGLNRLDHGLYIPSHNAVVRGNAVFGSAGFGIHLYSHPSGCQVYNNLCFDNVETGIIIAGPNNVIAHNVCVRNHAGGIMLFRGECHHNVIVNNVFSQNGVSGFVMDNGGGKMGDPTDNQIEGNIVSPAYSKGLLSPMRQWADNHALAGTPVFQDMRANDFRLRPGSAGYKSARPVQLTGLRAGESPGLFTADHYPTDRRR